MAVTQVTPRSTGTARAEGRSGSGEVSFHGIERKAGGTRARLPAQGKRAPLEEGMGHTAEHRGGESPQKTQKRAAERFQAQTIPVTQAFLPFSTSCLIFILPRCPESLSLFSMLAVCSHNGFFFFPLMCLSCSLCFVECTIRCFFIAKCVQHLGSQFCSGKLRLGLTLWHCRVMNHGDWHHFYNSHREWQHKEWQFPALQSLQLMPSHLWETALTCPLSAPETGKP